MPARQKVARPKRGPLRLISLFGVTTSRPARYDRSDKPAAPASEALRSLPKVPSEPSTLLRFKHIPSTATLDYLLDLSRRYGRVLRVQSRKLTQIYTLVIF
jgi:hypothetical protein